MRLKWKVKLNSYTKFLVFMMPLIMLLFACGVDKEVEEEANKIVIAVEEKNMEAVREIIFDKENLDVDEELNGYFAQSENFQDGIITYIIKSDSIEIKKIKESSIVYKITAPNMEKLFHDMMEEENLTSDLMKNYVYDYIDSAEMKNYNVEIAYSYENGNFIADYSSEEFVNALTGNLLSAYKEVMQLVIQEHTGEDTK